MNIQAEEKKADAGQGAKPVQIIVNGQQHQVLKDEMSFDEVVALDSSLVKGPNTVFTAAYRRGQGNKPEGNLVSGETVKVKEGMIFNVTATDKS